MFDPWNQMAEALARSRRLPICELCGKMFDGDNGYELFGMRVCPDCGATMQRSGVQQVKDWIPF